MEELDMTLFSVYENDHFIISKIIDQLYLGSEESSQRLEILQKYNIKKIVKIGYELKENFTEDIDYLCCSISMIIVMKTSIVTLINVINSLKKLYQNKKMF